MDLNDFDYQLPPELIAQEPLLYREQSRLLVLHKSSGKIEHRCFTDILEYLHKGDVLVSNNTRVIPARLYGRKKDTDAKIEVVLLKRLDGNCWEALVRPGKRVKVGTEIIFDQDNFEARVIEITPTGERILEFNFIGDFAAWLNILGKIPLPPYIHKQLANTERYQTVYAKNPGSAAAPTAGLHFTADLIAEIKAKGIEWVEILLHVGVGTFRPVKTEDITKHKMHREDYSISAQAAESINRALREKRRIIAVGTTSTRAMESAFFRQEIRPGTDSTDIFIYPGYEFKVISGLITNFHLPKSTLLMLVSAFAGRENVLRAYMEAIKERYRFFSFGDAMLII